MLKIRSLGLGAALMLTKLSEANPIVVSDELHPRSVGGFISDDHHTRHMEHIGDPYSLHTVRPIPVRNDAVFLDTNNRLKYPMSNSGLLPKPPRCGPLLMRLLSRVTK